MNKNVFPEKDENSILKTVSFTVIEAHAVTQSKLEQMWGFSNC